MATAAIEAGLDDGLLAYYDFDSGFSDQLVKRNIDRYPPLQLWRNEEAQPSEAADAFFKRESNATSAEIMLETNTFHRQNTGNVEINHADPYMVFPSLGDEVTQVDNKMELPSISFFFKVDPQPDSSTGGTVDYRLFGESIFLEYNGLLRVTQTWDTRSGRVSQTVTYKGPLLPGQWHHIYWRLGRPGTPQKLYVNGIDHSEDVGGDWTADDFGKTGFSAFRSWMYNMNRPPQGKDLPDQFTLHRGTVSDRKFGSNDSPDFPTRYARYSRIMFFNTDLTVDQIKYLAAGSYRPWHPAPEWTPPANYLSLALDNAYLIISDQKLVDNTRADNNFSVDLWLKYAEQITPAENESKDPSWIARRTDSWAIGITPSGALTAQVTWRAAGGMARTQNIVSTSILNSGVWQRVSLSVSSTGQINLYSGSLALAANVTDSTSSNIKPTYPVTASPALTLGSDTFSGELRSLVFYKPSQSLGNLRKSMYSPHMMTLPTDATCYLHLHNGSNPAGLIGKYPLTAMLPGESGLLKPTIKHIDAQLNKGPEIGLSLSTQAGCFTGQTYIDCGLNVFPSASKPSYTMDSWFMVAGDEHSDADHSHDHVLMSIGSEGGAGSPFFKVFVHANSASNGTRYELFLKSGTLAPDVGGYRYNEKLITYGELDADVWHHIALVFTAEQGTTGPIGSLLTTCFLDGKQLAAPGSPSIAGFVRANNMSLPHAILQQRPLLLGAELGQSGLGYEDRDRSSDLTVQRGLNGYIRLFRVWSTALSAGEITEMYDWSWQPDDTTNMLGQWSLEHAQPFDYADRNPTRPSSRFYTEVVAQMAHPGSTEEPLPSVPRTHPPHTTSKRGTIPPWVLLLADITVIFVSTLTPVRANVSKLITAFEKAFQNEKNAVVLFSKIRLLKLVVNSSTLTKVEKSKQIANAMIALFKWFYKSGLLVGVLRCFSLSIFGLANFVLLFVPIAGEVELAIDLLVASVGIVEAFQAYAQRLEESSKPPQLGIESAPERGDVVLLKVGEKKKWQIDCDPIVQDERELVVNIFCDQGLSGRQVLKLPDKLTFDRSKNKHDLEIEVLANCEKPIRIYFEKELFQDIIVEVQSYEFRLLPAQPQLQWYKEGSEWNWKVEFYVELLGTLLPGQTATWTPRPGDNMIYDIDKYVFSNAKGAKKPVKKKAPLKGVVKGKTPKAKPDSSKIELEGDGEVSSTEGALHIAATKAPTGKKTIKEEIFLYAVNATCGDAHTVWVERTDEVEDGEGVISTELHTANAIIDGGFQPTAEAMLSIPGHNPSSKSNIDLVIATHFDDDHVGGIAKLYEEIRSGTRAILAGTTPSMTLIPDTRRPPPGRMRVMATAGSAVLEGALSTPAALADHVQGLVMAFAAAGSPDSVIVAEAVFPRTKRSAVQAANVVNYCKGQPPHEAAWPLRFAPTEVPIGTTFELAGTEIKILAPTVTDMRNHVNKGYNDSRTTNRLSIINTFNSIAYPKFTSLWTGDAEDTTAGGRPYLGQTTAIGNVARHFTVLKVSHHASDRSGTEAWFKLCTADIYIIGANGNYGNPDPEVLQWIINGHYAKTLASPGTYVAPRIYITNPFFTNARAEYQGAAMTNLNFRGGAKIYQRATYPINDRKTETGYLGFTFENGEIVGWPDEVDLTTPNTVARTTLVEEVTNAVIRTTN